jgi:hypothetical protein
MSVRLERIRLIAFVAALCIAWFNAAVASPVEALSAPNKKVLVLTLPVITKSPGI